MRIVQVLLVLGLFGAVATFCGCATTEHAEDGEQEPSFPVKSIAEARYSFDSLDRKRAVRAYNRLQAHLLFELVIDREGNVVIIRTLRTRLDSYMTGAFRTHVRGMKFTPAPSDDPYPYRTLFYPVKSHTEFRENP